MTERPDWDETWLAVAAVIARRSLCEKSRVGAVVVTRDQRLNSTGYNGPPRGLRVEGPCSGWCPHAMGQAPAGAPSSLACASVHAEMNALLRADATLVEGGSLYCTRVPCMACARSVANSGLSRVVCSASRDDDPSRAAKVLAYLGDCGLETFLV